MLRNRGNAFNKTQEMKELEGMENARGNTKVQGQVDEGLKDEQVLISSRLRTWVTEM
jgi:hypothetical protein